MRSEAAQYADFSIIRYAQCWEDADILVPALNIKEGQRVLSICSAGDNTLSLLAQKPEKIYALDLNPAQIACLEIRIAAYSNLEYNAFLEFMGARESSRRLALYHRIKGSLSREPRAFWDCHEEDIAKGIGSAGKFERYFELFRKKVLPLVHGERKVNQLLEHVDDEERLRFYMKRWNNLRWQMLFRVFFSRFMMGRLGRDPSFFRYVEGSVADRILGRARYALAELDPSQNPYLHWILKGTYSDVLPHALREENFNVIRENLHRLEYRLMSVEDFVDETEENSIDAFNFSDIFEYMSESEMEKIFRSILKVGRSGGRLAYWNMLAPRHCPESLKDRFTSRRELSKELFLKDKAFFYSDFIIEEIV